MLFVDIATGCTASTAGICLKLAEGLCGTNWKRGARQGLILVPFFLFPQFLHPAVNIFLFCPGVLNCDVFFQKQFCNISATTVLCLGFFFLPKKTSYERKQLHLMESFLISWI